MKLHNKQEYTIYLGRPGGTQIRQLAEAVTEFGNTPELQVLVDHVHSLALSAYEKGRSLLDDTDAPGPLASMIEESEVAFLSYKSLSGEHSDIISFVYKLVNREFNRGYAEVGGLNPDVLETTDF